ncbi:MAG TPA: lytic transglycosylase F [Thermodesulfobacteriota bacterium]|nr:lytic transglycosylase F [Thermodesulfobacteriota bacterium]
MDMIRSRTPLFFFSLLFLIFSGNVLGADSPSNLKERPKQAEKALLAHEINKNWTGDLDGMVKRRVIRVLVSYSKTFYFNDRGAQKGLTYDVFKLFEDDLNKKLKNKHIRVHVIFLPVSPDKFIPYLLEGKGDIAAANLTIIPERLNKVDFSKPVQRSVSEIVVTGPATKPITSKEDLSGQEVYIRKSSSYYSSLEKLNADFTSRKMAPVKVRPAPESLGDEDLLEMVNAGLVKATVVDSHIAEFWKGVFPDMVLNREAAIRTNAEIGWMFRKNSPKLESVLNKFLDLYPEGSKTRNTLLQKYFKNTKYVKDAASPSEMSKFDNVVDLFRKYGDTYDLDYLLMMAQGYQESRLDQKAKSRVGAVGIMQVMPNTGKSLKVGDIKKIDPNIHAGVKYIRFMVDQYFKNEPMDRLNKGLFAFAAYNAGPNRIEQLRKQAAQRGLNPNIWFNNVEIIAAEKIGRETVTYVSSIFKYYLAYQLLVEEAKEKGEAIEQIKKEKE